MESSLSENDSRPPSTDSTQKYLAAYLLLFAFAGVSFAVEVQDRDRWPSAPYPPSEWIRAVEWSPADTVIRQADGSDNWPITWADDDHLYTA